MFSPHFVPPQTRAHLPYQREVGVAALNLHHFLQQMMDPKVSYLRTLPLGRCQRTVLQHHLAHMLNRLNRRAPFEGAAILTADRWPAELI
jgi:hypothetical protein